MRPERRVASQKEKEGCGQCARQVAGLRKWAKKKEDRTGVKSPGGRAGRARRENA